MLEPEDVKNDVLQSGNDEFLKLGRRLKYLNSAFDLENNCNSFSIQITFLPFIDRFLPLFTRIRSIYVGQISKAFRPFMY